MGDLQLYNLDPHSQRPYLRDLAAAKTHEFYTFLYLWNNKSLLKRRYDATSISSKNSGKAGQRRKSARALKKLREASMVDKILADIANQIAIRPHYDNFIGGTWVPAVKGQKFENISPIDGHVVCTIARSTAEDVELALDAAHAAREAWGRTSPAERAQTLLRIADRIEQKLDLLALVETIDNGKPIRETKAADLPLAIDHFRYFAGCLRAQEGSISEIDHDTVAYHFHEPLGGWLRSFLGISRS